MQHVTQTESPIGMHHVISRSRAQPAPAPEAKPNGSTAADELPVWHSMQVGTCRVFGKPSDVRVRFGQHGKGSDACSGTPVAGIYDLLCGVQGAKRLQAEFKYLTKQIAAGKVTQIHDVTFVNDNIFKWQVRWPFRNGGHLQHCTQLTASQEQRSTDKHSAMAAHNGNLPRCVDSCAVQAQGL